MENEFRLEVASLELPKEIIQTFPTEPRAVEISLYADGVMSIWERNRQDTKEQLRYMHECTTKGIIPNSSVVFIYENGWFKPEVQIEYHELKSEEEKKALDEIILKGNRFHESKVKILIPAAQGFFKLKNQFLDSLIQKGYELQRGEITTDTYYSKQHYAEGHYANGSVLFGKFSVELTGRALESKEILNWFNQLRGKYQAK